MDETTPIVEALIFVAPDPIGLDRIAEIIGDVTASDVESAIETLNESYERDGRVFRIIRGGGGYRFTTIPEYGRWIKEVVVGGGRIRLSRAALETISIIAYRQPITRGDVEAVRGVELGGILRTLLERGLIKISGRAKTPGRPLLYATTPEFLRHFGLDSLDELPAVGEFIDEK